MRNRLRVRSAHLEIDEATHHINEHVQALGLRDAARSRHQVDVAASRTPTRHWRRWLLPGRPCSHPGQMRSMTGSAKRSSSSSK